MEAPEENKPSHPVLRACCGCALVGLAVLGSLWWSARVERRKHPATAMLGGSDEEALRGELMWATQRALEFAQAGKFSKGHMLHEELHRSSFCVYVTSGDILTKLQAFKGKSLQGGKLVRTPGEAFEPASHFGGGWRLAARIGEEVWVFEFAWNSGPIGSSLNLMSVEPLNPKRKGSVWPVSKSAPKSASKSASKS